MLRQTSRIAAAEQIKEYASQATLPEQTVELRIPRAFADRWCSEMSRQTSRIAAAEQIKEYASQATLSGQTVELRIPRRNPQRNG